MRYIKKPSNQIIIKELLSLMKESTDVFLILAGEKTEWNIDEFISIANNQGIVFMGGVFPGLIIGNTKTDEGVLIKKFRANGAPILISELNKSKIDLPKIPNFVFEGKNNRQTALILADGLSSGITLFLKVLFHKLGNTVNYIGGGAGLISLKQEPCVFSNEGFFKDAAIILFTEQTINLGIKHGWTYVYGPIIATRTNKNIILELNWQNPFEVYKKIIDSDNNASISSENFFEISKGYPFGISKDNCEYIVRDPLKVNDLGHIICVGDIPVNSALDILKGNQVSLLSAAVDATNEAAEQISQAKSSLIFDCISRTLFLENGFKLELEFITDAFKHKNLDIKLEGALTLGEISSYNQSNLEFFNKTILLGLFNE
ncbi:MAG: FIST C-terminal domain-containing protein [Bacteroidales bacterium]|nr:FIST C-terminal domain-containing protein [Bacteroidales bacterium]